MPDNETRVLISAASMHDISKIATPDIVLLKPWKLTDAD